MAAVDNISELLSRLAQLSLGRAAVDSLSADHCSHTTTAAACCGSHRITHPAIAAITGLLTQLTRLSTPENRDVIVQSGGVSHLMRFLYHHSPAVQAHAADALLALAFDDVDSAVKPAAIPAAAAVELYWANSALLRRLHQPNVGRLHECVLVWLSVLLPAAPWQYRQALFGADAANASALMGYLQNSPTRSQSNQGCQSSQSCQSSGGCQSSEGCQSNSSQGGQDSQSCHSSHGSLTSRRRLRALLVILQSSADAGWSPFDAQVLAPGLIRLLNSRCGTAPDDAIRAAAAAALGSLAGGSGHPPCAHTQALLVQLGAVPELIRMLSSSEEEEVVTAALQALWRLARDNDENKRVLIDAGLVKQAVALLAGSRNAQVLKYACYVLKQLAWMSPMCQEAIVQEGGIGRTVAMVLDQGLASTLRAQAAEVLANMANVVGSYRDMILQAGALPGLMELLCSEHCLASQVHATETLMNLAWGSEANSRAVRDAGAAEVLLSLLDRAPQLVDSYNVWGVLVLGLLCLVLDPASDEEMKKKTVYMQRLVSWLADKVQGLEEEWSTQAEDDVSNMMATLAVAVRDGYGSNARLMFDAGVMPVLYELQQYQGDIPTGWQEAVAGILQILNEVDGQTESNALGDGTLGLSTDSSYQVCGKPAPVCLAVTGSGGCSEIHPVGVFEESEHMVCDGCVARCREASDRACCAGKQSANAEVADPCAVSEDGACDEDELLADSAPARDEDGACDEDELLADSAPAVHEDGACDEDELLADSAPAVHEDAACDEDELLADSAPAVHEDSTCDEDELLADDTHVVESASDDVDGMDMFLSAINGSDEELQLEAVEALLRFLASITHAAAQSASAQPGVIESLCQLLGRSTVRIQVTALKALTLLVHGHEPNQNASVECGAIPLLLQLLYSADCAVQTEAATVLGAHVMCEAGVFNKRSQRVILQAGGVAALFQLLCLLALSCADSTANEQLTLLAGAGTSGSNKEDIEGLQGSDGNKEDIEGGQKSGAKKEDVGGSPGCGSKEEEVEGSPGSGSQEEEDIEGSPGSGSKEERVEGSPGSGSQEEEDIEGSPGSGSEEEEEVEGSPGTGSKEEEVEGLWKSVEGVLTVLLFDSHNEMQVKVLEQYISHTVQLLNTSSCGNKSALFVDWLSLLVEKRPEAGGAIMVRRGAVSALTQLLTTHCTDTDVQVMVLGVIRSVATAVRGQPHVALVADETLIHVLLQLLGSCNSSIWTAAAPKLQRQHLDRGCLEAATLAAGRQLLRSCNASIWTAAVQALRSLALANTANATAMMAAGVVPLLIALLDDPRRDNTMDYIELTRTLHSIVGMHRVERQIVLASAHLVVPALTQLLSRCSDELVTKEVVVGLAKLARCGGHEIQTLVGQAGTVMQVLMHLLASADPDSQEAAASAIISFVVHGHSFHAGNQAAIAAAGVIPVLVQALRSPHGMCCRAAGFALMCLTAGLPGSQGPHVANRRMAAEAGAIRTLTQLLDGCDDADVEAALTAALCGVTGGRQGSGGV